MSDLQVRRRDETTKTIVDITGGAAGRDRRSPDRQRLIGRCEAGNLTPETARMKVQNAAMRGMWRISRQPEM